MSYSFFTAPENADLSCAVTAPHSVAVTPVAAVNAPAVAVTVTTGPQPLPVGLAHTVPQPAAAIPAFPPVMVPPFRVPLPGLPIPLPGKLSVVCSCLHFFYSPPTPRMPPLYSHLFP